MFCDLRIVRTAKFSELSDSIFLADFTGNNRSIGKVFNKRQVFRKDTLVDIKELFNNRSRKVERLHSRDLKTSL
jgi:hypothetical protein